MTSRTRPFLIWVIWSSLPIKWRLNHPTLAYISTYPVTFHSTVTVPCRDARPLVTYCRKRTKPIEPDPINGYSYWQVYVISTISIDNWQVLTICHFKKFIHSLIKVGVIFLSHIARPHAECNTHEVRFSRLYAERVAAKHPASLDQRFVHLGTEQKEWSR